MLWHCLDSGNIDQYEEYEWKEWKDPKSLATAKHCTPHLAPKGRVVKLETTRHAIQTSFRIVQGVQFYRFRYLHQISLLFLMITDIAMVHYLVDFSIAIFFPGCIENVRKSQPRMAWGRKDWTEFLLCEVQRGPTMCAERNRSLHSTWWKGSC